MGRPSFGACLLHFAVLTILPKVPGVRANAELTGRPAKFAYPFGALVILIIMLPASWCTGRAVELPMIGLGKAPVRKWRDWDRTGGPAPRPRLTCKHRESCCGRQVGGPLGG